MSESKRDVQAIEKKWQSRWQESGLFTCDFDDPRPSFYCLTMFPYPSGALHMGHVIVYTLGDVISRYRLRKGCNVLSPMGWDSFGLNAENAAIKSGIHPQDSIRSNIDTMRSQMVRAGWGYDWRRELATSHPGYYRWTQALFLKFYERGLACRKTAPVNWCPQDQRRRHPSTGVPRTRRCWPMNRSSTGAANGAERPSSPGTWSSGSSG
jgi:leucyl-tRNA synthetase